MGRHRNTAISFLAVLALSLSACATQPAAVPAPPAEAPAAQPAAPTTPDAKPAPAASPTKVNWPAPQESKGEASDDESAVVSLGAKNTRKVAGVDCSKKKCVALTYDDGPGLYTETLLKHLAKEDAKATFFMVGQMAKARPEVVKKVAAQGHAIANHTWNHPDLRRLSLAGQKKQVNDTSKLLKKLSGQPVTMLRPPYGAYNSNTKKLGVSLIMWDVDTNDWKTRSTSQTIKRALAGVKPGSIVLMHDIHKPTVDAAPKLIKELKKRGYTLVTVPQLLGTTKAGKVYTDKK